MISAEIVLDSVANGVRLITIKTVAPKFLDAEIEKHRMISSNSSSDRAVPFSKMVEKEFYLPQDVRLNQPGMQGYKKLSPMGHVNLSWTLRQIRNYTIDRLKSHSDVHKQTLNRYLLGFSLQSKVMTATEDQWSYFLFLRNSEYADPAIQELAKLILSAITNSVPTKLELGEWHMPFITDLEKQQYDIEDLKLASAGRCARTSYSNHDKSDPVVIDDVNLALSLKRQHHETPFEHVATPMDMSIAYSSEIGNWPEGVTHIDRYCVPFSGNFKAWIQLRKLL